MGVNVKKVVAASMGVAMGVAPVMPSVGVSEVNAESVQSRGYGVTLGNQYTMTWTASDNGKVKDYDMAINGNKLVVKIQQMKFQSGQELEWTIKLINSAGQVVGTQKASECAIVNNERVATFNNLTPGNYTVRLDPSLHIYDGVVNVGVSFTSDGNVSDWKDHWAREEIQKAMTNGWVDTADIFRPNDGMTRAEVVKVINRAYGLKGTTSLPFNDVKPGDWYYNEIQIALANNLISKDVSFRPNDKVTRQEFATMISNIETGKKGDPVHDKYMKYQDYYQSGEWARDSIEYTIEKGYMGKGGQVFNPVNNITRAEAVTTLARIK